MGNTVFDVLNKKLIEHKNSISEVLADGGCKDFAHYKNLCGVIHGLSIAQREVSDLARNFMDDDND